MKSIAVPEKHAASLRVKQLDMVRRITFIMIMANLLNAGIVTICFHGTAASDLLYIWGAAVLLANSVAVATQFFNPKNMDPMGERSQQALDNFTRAASLNGLLWGIAPSIVMHAADPQGQMVMGIIMAGMMFAGTFIMARTPNAAFAFLLPVAIGVIAAMVFQEDTTYQFMSLLTLAYVGVLMLLLQGPVLSVS